MYASDLILIVTVSFLIGSIPFGILLAKAFRLPDPRTIGSGNIGATNMLRTGNKKVALLTLLLDAAKGIAPVLLFSADNGTYGAVAYLAALLGHCYTPWLKFKGGKGVATAVGAAFALHWAIGLSFAIAWLGVFFATRYVSLASIIALIAMPAAAAMVFAPVSGAIIAIASCVAIWRHRANIARLRAGTEPKMMGKKKHA